MRSHEILKTGLMTIVNYNDFFFLDFTAYSLLNTCSAVFTEVFVCRGLGVRNLLKQIEELFIPSSVNALLQRDANYEQEKKRKF